MNQTAIDINKQIEELNQLGNQYWINGEKEKAKSTFQHALELGPFYPPSLNAMGIILTDEKKFEDAEQVFLKGITFAPQYAPLYDNLGRVLYFMKRFEEAAQRFSTAISFDSSKHEYFYNLATVLFDMRNFKAAIENYDLCLDIAPNYANAWNGKGQCHMNISEIEEAGNCYKKAIDLNPNDELLYHNLYAYYDMTHDKEGAQNIIDRAKKHITGSTRLTYLEARHLAKQKEYEKGLSLLENVEIPKDSLGVDILFEAAWMYDKTESPEKAFNCLTQGNRIQSQENSALQIDVNAFPNLLKTESDFFQKENIKNWTSSFDLKDNGNLVFLTGFPRSGTTLIGQILHSHPEIYVGEENGATEELRAFLALQQPNYPECLATLDQSAIIKAQQHFLDIHKAQPDYIQKRFLVDKSPLNSGQIGLVHRIFPNSKIIFVRRHPCDCILSCFMQKFRPSLSLIHFMEIDRAAKFYTTIMDCWEHYNEILDLDVYEIKYEELVDNFEDETKKLLDFTGVAWNDSVLTYNKKAAANPRTITPSYSQVTEKIYTGAKFRWEKYRKQLEPVFDILAPYVEKAGYAPIE
jgi:tetratricopeptide (TPR) repeat protein